MAHVLALQGNEEALGVDGDGSGLSSLLSISCCNGDPK